MNCSFDITLKNRAILLKFLTDFSLDQLNEVPKDTEILYMEYCSCGCNPTIVSI